MTAEKSVLVEKPSLEKTKDLVEIIGKSVVGFAALCYVLGLIVVNLHLNSYGVYSLSLFRLNYVAAGIWTLMPILIIALGMGILWLFANLIVTVFKFSPKTVLDSVGLKQKRKDLGVLILLLSIAFIVVYLVAVNLNMEFHVNWRRSLFGSFWIVLFFQGALITFKDRSSDKFRRSFAYAFSLVTFCFLIGHTYFFATRIYQSIPPHLGGGGPTQVELLLKLESSDKQFFELAGLPFHKDSNRTRTVNLLFTTDDEYVLLIIHDISTPGEVRTTLSVRKELVQSIRYQALYRF